MSLSIVLAESYRHTDHAMQPSPRYSPAGSSRPLNWQPPTPQAILFGSATTGQWRRVFSACDPPPDIEGCVACPLRETAQNRQSHRREGASRSGATNNDSGSGSWVFRPFARTFTCTWLSCEDEA